MNMSELVIGLVLGFVITIVGIIPAIYMNKHEDDKHDENNR